MHTSPNRNQGFDHDRLDIYGGKERIATVFNWFLVLMLVSLLAGVFILLSNNNTWEAIITSTAAVPILLALYLVRRKKAEGAAVILALVMILLMTLLATRGQGIHNITILALPPILIVASLVSRKRTMALLTFFCVVGVAWLVFGDVYGLYTPNPTAHSVPGDFFSVSLVLIATAAMVRLITDSLYRSNHQLQTELKERELAEQALALSEKKFSEAFHTSPVMMTIEGDDHKFIDVNQAFLDGIGCSREEVIGSTASDLRLWASDEDVERVRKIAAEGNGVKNLELHFRRRSGEIGVIIMSSDRFEINGVPYELTSGLDITERRQTEDTLFEEKELAQVTLRSIGDAVITTNIDAQIQFLNPIAENLTGWRVEDAIGRDLVDVFRVINEDTRMPVVDPVARCLREGCVVGLANHSILIRRDGREFSIDDSAAPIRNRKGEIVGTVLVFHDITEERRLSLQVAHDAMHDSLTGLVNRREFERRLEGALVSTKERNLSHVLCYLDMDQFKIVNDTAGHAAGDELLKQVAVLLSGLFRQTDTFARLGGDEFGLLLENCQIDQAQVICNKILAKTRDFSFMWDGNNFQAGVSIGIVPINAEKESVDQLLSQADIACYSAKDLGRSRYYVYQSEDIETVQRHSEIIQAARMRDAVLNNQFILYCQPIVELASSRSGFARYEVLLRLQNEENNLILPDAFIPSAERYGLMPAIDRWVIRRTFSTIAQSALRDVQVTINLSGNSLDDENLLDYVLEQLQEFSIPPHQICFEITETAAIHHINKARQFIQGFRERGGKIALDDFGSGFSSFRYLKTLAVDYLKIDGAFVSEMLFNPSDQAMVEAITQVAHTLGIYVIAEHATNMETVDRLRELGVEGAQGFGLGFPIPVSEAWRIKG